jgi:arylsulfatase
MTRSPPNVILLSADALRADHLSCYGYHRETTPVLDALATESYRFENAYSASSHTREAVPALLTGAYPDVAVDHSYHLVTESVATTLSAHGFVTAGYHSNPFVSRAYGFDQGFTHFDDDLHLGQHKLIALAQRALDKLRNRHYARAEEINERSLKWLDSVDDEDSVFLWNHYMDTHGPYEPPGEYATLYADDRVSGREAQALYQRAIDDPESIAEDERQLLVDLYDAEIRYNDAQIGAFLDALREHDLLEESLVIVTADHGDAFGEHGYYEHPRYLHDEITHVPLLVRPPGGASGTVEAPVSTLDVVPTVEAAVGVGDGISLLGDLDPDRCVFSQARGEDDDDHLRRYAVRTTEGACFAERDRETGTVTVTDGDRSLQATLEDHIAERVRVENGDDGAGVGEGGGGGEVNEEIEQRLSALGYRE